ncbi:MAG: DMT family transporter [Ignavibacteriales bacterium]|nr:DMT family transporter [Ignavibacteriales bacterium]
MLTSNSKYKSEAILILVTLLWGGTFVIVKEALNDVSSMAFIAIRFLIAAAILLSFMHNKKFTKQNLRAVYFYRDFIIYWFCYSNSWFKIYISNKVCILNRNSCNNCSTASSIIEKRPPTKGVIIGTMIVMIGISFLSSGGSSINNLFVDLGTNFNLGDLLTLICAFFFALYIIYLDVETSRYDFGILLFLQIITTAVLSLLFLIFFSNTNLEPLKINLTTNLVWAIIYTSIFATLITTALQTKFQKNVTPAKAGIIFSFEPIFAAVFAFFILGEKITNFGYLGAGLILVGLLISELYENLLLKNER